MMKNLILDELHAARQKLLADADGDLHRYVEEARQRALTSGRHIVKSSENQSSPPSAIKSLDQRFAFLKLPMAERRQILESQAETMVTHYQQESEWQELMAGDIIDY